VFITRASRHDKADIQEFLDSQGWHDADLGRGVTFYGRDGGIVGCVRLVEVDPQAVVVEDVVVHGTRRREGIGTGLMRAAMSSRGGTLYLCCHGEQLGFYARVGFTELDAAELPGFVATYLRQSGDLDPPEGHEHFFMKAR
jgi:N-acetylglutamate synthase-like GNAT family acetyltransferase